MAFSSENTFACALLCLAVFIYVLPIYPLKIIFRLLSNILHSLRLD